MGRQTNMGRRPPILVVQRLRTGKSDREFPVWKIKNLPKNMKMKRFRTKELADKCFEECLKEYRKSMKEQKKREISEAMTSETSFKAKDASASSSKLTKENVKSSSINEGKTSIKEKAGGKVAPITTIYAHGCCLDHGHLSNGTPNIASGVGVYMDPQHEATALQTLSEPWDTPSKSEAALRAAYLALEMASKSGCKYIEVKMSNFHTVKSLNDWMRKCNHYRNKFRKAKMPKDAVVDNYGGLERIETKRNELLKRGGKVKFSHVDENDPKNKLAVSLARGGAQEKMDNLLELK